MREIKPETYEAEMSLEPSKENYPHFGISLNHLPEAKKWEIGETYYITLEIKQTHLDTFENKKTEGGHAGFDITGIEVVDDKSFKKTKNKELPDIE